EAAARDETREIDVFVAPLPRLRGAHKQHRREAAVLQQRSRHQRALACGAAGEIAGRKTPIVLAIVDRMNAAGAKRLDDGVPEIVESERIAERRNRRSVLADEPRLRSVRI